jgi:hypothetical protein
MVNGMAEPRILVPQEHGTYGEILFPLVTALALGRPGWIAWAIVAAAAGGYLAHEGLVVLLGLRGARAGRERRSAAVRSLALFGTLGLTGGALAWAIAGPDTRQALLLAVALSALAVALAWAGRERSAIGEVLAGIALPSWGVPVALAVGAGWPAALACWGVWVVTFSASTLAVRVVIARAKRKDRRPALLGVALMPGLALALLWPLVALDNVPGTIAWALLPTGIVVLALAVMTLPAQRLKAIGWTLMAASLATVAVLVAVLR